MNKRYSIREAEAETNVSAHTLRYYERIGLIQGIARNGSGHRQYSQDDLDWVTILACLRQTGMSIQQMQTFAALVTAGDQTIPSRYAFLQAHHAEVQNYITELMGAMRVIEEKMGKYQAILEL